MKGGGGREFKELCTPRALNTKVSFSYHCKDWKDVLLCRVAFENAVYRLSYSARNGLVMASIPAKFAGSHG